MADWITHNGEPASDFHASDLIGYVPAARCRRCGVVTWELSISKGMRRPPRMKHHKGCRKPVGRIDLQARVPLAVREELGGVLDMPMTDEALRGVERLVSGLVSGAEGLS